MKMVYVVTVGNGDNGSDGVWVMNEIIDAIYQTEELAIQHAECWRKRIRVETKGYSEFIYDKNYYRAIDDKSDTVWCCSFRSDNGGSIDEIFCSVERYLIYDKLMES